MLISHIIDQAIWYAELLQRIGSLSFQRKREKEKINGITTTHTKEKKYGIVIVTVQRAWFSFHWARANAVLQTDLLIQTSLLHSPSVFYIHCH